VEGGEIGIISVTLILLCHIVIVPTFWVGTFNLERRSVQDAFPRRAWERSVKYFWKQMKDVVLKYKYWL